MKEKGLARFKDEWVPEADVPFLNMGWTKDDKGVWANPVEVARAKQIAEWKAAGLPVPRRRQQLGRAGRHRRSGRRSSGSAATSGSTWPRRTSSTRKIEQPWELAGEHFIVWTTCDWEGGELGALVRRQDLPRARAPLRRRAERRKPHFIVLNSLAQYNQAARRQPADAARVRGHLLAARRLLRGPLLRRSDVEAAAVPRLRRQLLGPQGREAAGAGDPTGCAGPRRRASSTRSIPRGARSASGSRAAARRRPRPSRGAFWGEKKIPRWLRYGAASYVERFMKNPEAAEGGDPVGAARRSPSRELKKAGGLRKLDDIFAFALDINDIAGLDAPLPRGGPRSSPTCSTAPRDDKKLAREARGLQDGAEVGLEGRTSTRRPLDALQKELAKNEREHQEVRRAVRRGRVTSRAPLPPRAASASTSERSHAAGSPPVSVLPLGHAARVAVRAASPSRSRRL